MSDEKKMLHDRLIIEGWGAVGDMTAADLADEIERMYVPLPVDENGEPWRIGDKFYHEKGQSEVIGYARICNASCVVSPIGNFVVKSIKRPVLDAKGVPIEVGDTVYDKDCNAFVVRDICKTKDCIIADKADGKEKEYHLAGFLLTHIKPDSLDKIIEDMGRYVCDHVMPGSNIYNASLEWIKRITAIKDASD